MFASLSHSLSLSRSLSLSSSDLKPRVTTEHTFRAHSGPGGAPVLHSIALTHPGRRRHPTGAARRGGQGAWGGYAPPVRARQPPPARRLPAAAPAPTAAVPGASCPPAPSGENQKSVPRGAPMQHVPPRRNPRAINWPFVGAGFGSVLCTFPRTWRGWSAGFIQPSACSVNCPKSRVEYLRSNSIALARQHHAGSAAPR